MDLGGNAQLPSSQPCVCHVQVAAKSNPDLAGMGTGATTVNDVCLTRWRLGDVRRACGLQCKSLVHGPRINRGEQPGANARLAPQAVHRTACHSLAAASTFCRA